MVARTPQSRKQKGRSFQQDIVADLLEMYSDELTPADVYSTSMGSQGIDVKLSTKARALFPYAVECKRKESINVHGEFKQARTNATKEGLIPLLISKKNREATLVHLEWDVFKGLLETLYTLKRDQCKMDPLEK